MLLKKKRLTQLPKFQAACESWNFWVKSKWWPLFKLGSQEMKKVPWFNTWEIPSKHLTSKLSLVYSANYWWFWSLSSWCWFNTWMPSASETAFLCASVSFSLQGSRTIETSSDGQNAKTWHLNMNWKKSEQSITRQSDESNYISISQKAKLSTHSASSNFSSFHFALSLFSCWLKR